MLVQIKTKDERGRWVSPSASDFAHAALREISNTGSSDRWDWLRWCLCRFCIFMADDNAGNAVLADRWYDRYKAIRGIE